MTLWQRFSGFLKNQLGGWFSQRTAAVKASVSDFSKWFSPHNIFETRTSTTLASNETVFAAVSRLSNGMASLPLKLYKDFEPVHTPVADLVANAPNGNMTSFDFIRTMEAHRNTNGNAYALKMYNRSYQVESLHILDPTKVTPVIESRTGELWYEIEGDKGRYYVHNMDIIHVKHIHTVGHKGISPLDVLKNTVDYDARVRKFSLDQMDSAIYASFILALETQLSPEKKASVLKNFADFYRENGGVLIQEAGTKITPIERSFIDSKAFEVEKITLRRVATVYNMSAHMLGTAEGGSYSSMEQLSLDFVQGTLVPTVRQYEQELNRKLLTPEARLQGLGFKFNVNALLRGDIKTRGEFYFKGIRSGWFKPNEVRAYEELPPVEGGNELYMSKDLAPIGTRGEVK